jgi:hypothetical protein
MTLSNLNAASAPILTGSLHFLGKLRFVRLRCSIEKWRYLPTLSLVNSLIKVILHSFSFLIEYLRESWLDSMGNKETLDAGSLQYMSAGTGVYHSEFNGGENPVRFIQVRKNHVKRSLG